MLERDRLSNWAIVRAAVTGDSPRARGRSCSLAVVLLEFSLRPCPALRFDPPRMTFHFLAENSREIVGFLPVNDFVANFFESCLHIGNVDILAPGLLALARGLLALLGRFGGCCHGGWTKE